MRFDSYCVTLPIVPEKLVDDLLEQLPYSGLDLIREKGKNNYQHADVIKDGRGETVCMVLHGGNGGKPHLRSQGVYSPDIATIVRGFWPDHPVTRADVAIDFDGQDAFRKLHAMLDGQAERRGLKVDMVGDWRTNRDPLSGRTYYLGSRTSTVFMRLYEKGLQQLAKYKNSDQPVSVDWTRLEIEVKPQNPKSRYRAAHLQPVEFWGVTTWSRDILRMACSLDVERVNMNLKRESEALTASKHMVSQYRQTLMRASAESGETEVQLFQRLLKEHDERARAKCGPAWFPGAH